MKALLHILPLLLLVALAAGCRPSESERSLRAAEELMEARPDSALTLLEAIDGSRLSGEPRARHALLLSQAYDKNYIDLTSDSLISIAVNFYADSDDLRRRMLALHYLASVYLNSDDYVKAIMPALEAYSLALDAGDAINCTREESLLSILFDCTYNSRTALDYALLSLSHTKQIDKPVWLNNAYSRLAKAYLNVGNYDSALIYSDSLKLVNNFPVNSYSNLDILIYYNQHRYDKIIAFEDSIITGIDSSSVQMLTLLSVAHYYDGDKKKSEKYAKLAWQHVANKQDSIDANVALRLQSDCKDLPDKYELSEYLSDKQDSIIRELTNHSLYQAQNLFEREITKQKQAEMTLNWHMTIAVATFCLLLSISLFFLIVYLRKQHGLRQLQNEHEMYVLTTEFEKLKNEFNTAQQFFSVEREHTDSAIATLNREIAEGHRRCNELFIARFSWIVKLGNLYLDSVLHANAPQTLHKKVKEELSSVKLSGFKTELITIINTYHDNLIARIETQCPSLTKAELDYVVLSCAGLTSRIIAFLLCKTIPSVYNLKSKVRTKFSSEAPQLFDEYCQIVGKHL